MSNAEPSKVICVICGKHENTHIGRVKACFQGMGTSFKSEWIANFEKEWREQHETSALEQARQQQAECARTYGGDDIGQEEERGHEQC